MEAWFWGVLCHQNLVEPFGHVASHKEVVHLKRSHKHFNRLVTSGCGLFLGYRQGYAVLRFFLIMIKFRYWGIPVKFWHLKFGELEGSGPTGLRFHKGRRLAVPFFQISREAERTPPVSLGCPYLDIHLVGPGKSFTGEMSMFRISRTKLLTSGQPGAIATKWRKRFDHALWPKG